MFACLFLDNRHRIINNEILFTGTIDGASVYPREVVKRCLELNAAAIIFAHNHLFASAESLANPEITDDELKQELERSKLLIPTAKTILECASLSLDAAKFTREWEHGQTQLALPAVFTGEPVVKQLSNGSS